MNNKLKNLHFPQVAPSILSADFASLAESCRQVADGAHPLIHFDVMDGQFVDNITVGLPVLQSLKKALPGLLYDVHLMIQNPGRFARRFIAAGADILTFHVESEGDTGAILADIRAAGALAGLSLRPGTPLSALNPHLSSLDLVLVMSVEPGFGGQAFNPEAPERIRALRQNLRAAGNTDALIEVDGGVNAKTAPLCLSAGADLLVAGSAVFGADDPAAAARGLLKPQQ